MSADQRHTDQRAVPYIHQSNITLYLKINKNCINLWIVKVLNKIIVQKLFSNVEYAYKKVRFFCI